MDARAGLEARNGVRSNDLKGAGILNDDLRKRAYHEAGHAVAAYVLHKRPLKSSIIEEGISMGRTVHIMPPKIDQPRSQPWIERHIIYCLAGRTAEKNLAPERWDDTDDMRSAADLAEVQEYVNRLLSAERVAKTPYIGSVEAYQSWMQARTDALIAREWETVAAVAQDLLLHKEMREHQLRRVIATAKRKEAPDGR